LDELENLLMLDGEIFYLENGYWVKFEAKRVEKTRTHLKDPYMRK
jgi:hypothetical protein